MLKNIIISFYRFLRRNKLYTFINVFGLSVAIGIFIFIFLFIENETSFDKHHQFANEIYRVTTEIKTPGGNTHLAIGNEAFGYILKKECPEVTNMACFDIGSSHKVRFSNVEILDVNIRMATASVFEMFTYPAVYGNPDEFLKEPNTIILTQSLSKKIFGEINPVNKSVLIGKDPYTVKGVIKDLPSNTDLKFSALIPMYVNGTEELINWGEYYVYIRVHNATQSDLQNKINNLTAKHYGPLCVGELKNIFFNNIIQPLTELHFETSLTADTPKGNKIYINVFMIVAVLIIIIAGINYTNLNIVQLTNRFKEISIKKTIGLSKNIIYIQTISESLFLILISAGISLILLSMVLPGLNNLFNKDFNFQSITRLFIPLGIFFILFGIISGIYPAIILSKLTGKKTGGLNNGNKILVTSQYFISCAMIICILFIGIQIKYMKNFNLGFNKDQILAIPVPYEEGPMPGKEVIQNEFSELSEIKGVAFGGNGTQLGTTGQWMKSIMTITDANQDHIQFISHNPFIDENYINLFQIKLLKGRNFSKEFASDLTNGVIVNETYVKTMKWKDPLGKKIDENWNQIVIGVVEDFHFASLHNPIEPLMFSYLNNKPVNIFVKANPKNLDLIRAKWNQITNNAPFEYRFIDENFDRQYRKDEREMSIFMYLTLIAIIISCLGLFGLASFLTVKRTKEIGIRKVNGAKINEILLLLNRDIIIWITIAFIIAVPVAYLSMNKWLQNFAYHTSLNWWVFILGGLIAFVIALLTVSYQSVNAARRNPVEALRYE